MPSAARGRRRLLGVSLVVALIAQAPLVTFHALGAPSPAAASSVRATGVGSWFQSELWAALKRAQWRSGAPGLSLGFLTADDRQWRGVSGTHGDGTPLNADDPLRIGSVSKSFTAAIVLALVDEGRLGLDEDADRYLPDSPLLRHVTIRHLLNHTSGISDLYGPTKAILHGNPGHALSAGEVLGGLSRSGRPGRSYAYSNSNYYLLGLVIESVTGRTFNEELAARFTQPLGLSRTRLLTADDAGLPPAWSTAFFTSGAMVSTPRDLARWGRALYGGGAISKRMTRAMTDFDAGRSYDLGAQRLSLGRRSVPGHSGLLYDTTSLLVYLPRHRISIAIVGTAPHTDLESALIRRYGGPSILDVIIRLDRG